MSAGFACFHAQATLNILLKIAPVDDYTAVSPINAFAILRYRWIQISVMNSTTALHSPVTAPGHAPNCNPVPAG